MPCTSAKPKTGSRKVNRVSAKPTAKKKPIEQYDHKGKERVNNPPVGLVTPDTDQETTKKTYAYDPHLDPQLVWAGKAEHTSFEVLTVSCTFTKAVFGVIHSPLVCQVPITCVNEKVP